MNSLTKTQYIPGEVLLADDMTAIATKINELVDAVNSLQTELESVKSKIQSVEAQQDNYLDKSGGTINGSLTVTGNMKANYFEQTGA